MMNLAHKNTLRYLHNQTSTKEGAALAKQLLFFAMLWIVITGGIALLGHAHFSINNPRSWLMLFLPFMGIYLLLLAYQSHHYWQVMGRGTLHLAKATFHAHDHIQGYIEFECLSAHKDSQATVHISLKKKQANRQYEEKWSTKADTHTCSTETGLRVTFSSQVHPILEELPTPQQYVWCLYVCLQHQEELFRQSFEIAISEAKNVQYPC